MYDFDLSDPTTREHLKDLCVSEKKKEEEDFGPNSWVIIKLRSSTSKSSAVLYTVEKVKDEKEITFIGDGKYIVKRRILEKLEKAGMKFEELLPDGSQNWIFKDRIPVKTSRSGIQWVDPVWIIEGPNKIINDLVNDIWREPLVLNNELISREKINTKNNFFHFDHWWT